MQNEAEPAQKGFIFYGVQVTVCFWKISQNIWYHVLDKWKKCYLSKITSHQRTATANMQPMSLITNYGMFDHLRLNNVEIGARLLQEETGGLQLTNIHT